MVSHSYVTVLLPASSISPALKSPSPSRRSASVIHIGGELLTAGAEARQVPRTDGAGDRIYVVGGTGHDVGTHGPSGGLSLYNCLRAAHRHPATSALSGLCVQGESACGTFLPYRRVFKNLRDSLIAFFNARSSA